MRRGSARNANNPFGKPLLHDADASHRDGLADVDILNNQKAHDAFVKAFNCYNCRWHLRPRRRRRRATGWRGGRGREGSGEGQERWGGRGGSWGSLRAGGRGGESERWVGPSRRTSPPEGKRECGEGEGEEKDWDDAFGKSFQLVTPRELIGDPSPPLLPPSPTPNIKPSGASP